MEKNARAFPGVKKNVLNHCWGGGGDAQYSVVRPLKENTFVMCVFPYIHICGFSSFTWVPQSPWLSFSVIVEVTNSFIQVLRCRGGGARGIA